MAFRQDRQKLPEQFAWRVIEQQEQVARKEPEPATVWRVRLQSLRIQAGAMPVPKPAP
jgi:hypothetical protein